MHQPARPGGYGAVQVAPPEDSVSIVGRPRREDCQPVDGNLIGPLDERQCTAMVDACHAAGVKGQARAVITRTTGHGSVP
ncbi:hypothetical protein [Streptomyces sp. NPDC127038]|uniref:hypothetical protein n=1 Tax=Streptomyces sp. NPDC127038 TaxID=3347114 RepID=UPI00366A0291